MTVNALGPVALVASLEPLASLGFAVCLAYLGLDPFRYRSKIEDHAKLELIDLDGSGTLTGLEHYKWLLWLAGNKGEPPSGFFGFAYGIIFRRRLDTLLVVTLAAAAVIVLVAGVALQGGIYPAFAILGTTDIHSSLFTVLTTSLLLPVGLILSGRACVKRGCLVATKCREQVTLKIHAGMQELKPPPTPPLAVAGPKPRRTIARAIG